MVKAVIRSLIILLSLFSNQALASNLSTAQEQIILSGNHAPYSDQTILYVQNKYAEPIVTLKRQRPLTFDIDYNYSAWDEPADRWMWVLFWGLQIADIYSTHEGVKWDCISEANPLLPSIPTITEMATLKGVVLLPSYGAIGYENITRAELVAPLLLTGYVVHHNIQLTNKAKNRCNLR